jgi:hypothetical protein
MKNQLRKEYPFLHALIENKQFYIRGSLFIFDIYKNKKIDRYSIEIKIPQNYPESIPIVKEIGARLPKTIDRHFFPFDKSACLFLRDERYKYFPPGSSIIDFIKGPVENFFLSQTYFDSTGKWLFGERSHGSDGIIEFYSEELGTDKYQAIKIFLEYLSSKKCIKGHRDCYCGSGKKLRDCHLTKLIDFRSKISPEDAKKSLIMIKMNWNEFYNLLEDKLNKWNGIYDKQIELEIIKITVKKIFFYLSDSKIYDILYFCDENFPISKDRDNFLKLLKEIFERLAFI